MVVNHSNVFIVMAAVLSLFLAGCVSQDAVGTPTPYAAPSPQATLETPSPSSLPSLSPAPAAVSSPSPEPSGEVSLAVLAESARGVLFGVFGQDAQMDENRNPVNGEVTFEGGASGVRATFQAKVYKPIFQTWPAGGNFVNVTGPGGRTKEIRFPQGRPNDARIDFSFDMECNGFRQMISVSGFEINTAVYPFSNLAMASAEKMVDVCP